MPPRTLLLFDRYAISACANVSPADGCTGESLLKRTFLAIKASDTSPCWMEGTRRFVNSAGKSWQLTRSHGSMRPLEEETTRKLLARAWSTSKTDTSDLYT